MWWVLRKFFWKLNAAKCDLLELQPPFFPFKATKSAGKKREKKRTKSKRTNKREGGIGQTEEREGRAWSLSSRPSRLEQNLSSSRSGESQTPSDVPWIAHSWGLWQLAMFALGSRARLFGVCFGCGFRLIWEQLRDWRACSWIRGAFRWILGVTWRPSYYAWSSLFCLAVWDMLDFLGFCLPGEKLKVCLCRRMLHFLCIHWCYNLGEVLELFGSIRVHVQRHC